MNIPLCRAISVGELTPWGKQFLGGLETSNIADLTYWPSVEKFLSLKPSSQIQIIFVEVGSDAARITSGLRNSGRRFYIVMFGKIFSKEDSLLAVKNRVYLVFENISPDSEEVTLGMTQLKDHIEKERRFDLLVRSLKSVLIEAEGDVAQAVMSELRSAVGRLGTSGAISEFSEGRRIKTSKGDNKLFLYDSDGFGDAIRTIDGLERTGVLWVKGDLPGQEGQVSFLQGKIVSATSGVVHGLKAVYRMFLWDKPQYLFTRREHEELDVEEPINVSIDMIAAEGAEYRRTYEEVRRELPPKEIILEMDPNYLVPGNSVSETEFSTLSSVVEFGKVATVLNYNPLPDATIYHALINLRKTKMIRIKS